MFKKLLNQLNIYSKRSHDTSDYKNNAKLARKRDNFTCLYCKQPGHIVHHLVPLSKGGTHHPKNLVTVCEQCHRKVHLRRGEKV